jgi:hypothetical protein
MAPVLESQADRSTTELRILFIVETDIRDPLIPTQVESTNRNGPRVDGFNDPTIELLLLFFTGETTMREGE